MDLQSYIKSYPRNQRSSIRTEIAKAHKVSEVTVRAWANKTRGHPYTLEAVTLTESLTGGQVTRYDLRPEIFGSQAPGSDQPDGAADTPADEANPGSSSESSVDADTRGDNDDGYTAMTPGCDYFGCNIAAAPATPTRDVLFL